MTKRLKYDTLTCALPRIWIKSIIVYTSLYHDHADHVTCFICPLFGSHNSRFLMVNCGESNPQHVFSMVGLLPINLQHRSWQFVHSPADRINHGWLRRTFQGMRPYEACQVTGLKEIASAIEKASTKWGTLSCSCESDQICGDMGISERSQQTVREMLKDLSIATRKVLIWKFEELAQVGQTLEWERR